MKTFHGISRAGSGNVPSFLADCVTLFLTDAEHP
jgi:hypothetical protein